MVDPLIEQPPDPFEVAHVAGVMGEFLQAGLGDPGEKGDRVPTALGP
jgi:hypothetical protein